MHVSNCCVKKEQQRTAGQVLHSKRPALLVAYRSTQLVHTSAAAMCSPSSSALILLRLLLPDAARARRLPSPALLLPSTAAAAAAASLPANSLGMPDRRCLLDSFRCFRGLRTGPTKQNWLCYSLSMLGLRELLLYAEVERSAYGTPLQDSTRQAELTGARPRPAAGCASSTSACMFLLAVQLLSVVACLPCHRSALSPCWLLLEQG